MIAEEVGLTLETLEAVNEDQAIRIKILSRAIEEPLRPIVANASEDAAVVLADVKKGKGTYGYTPRPASTAT